MDRDDKDGMAPEDGAKALFDIVGEVAEISEKGDLGEFEAVFARMEEIVAATDAEIPGFDEKIDMLRQLTSLEQGNFDEMDAAMWAGDFARAERLMSGGCELEGLDLGAAFALDEEGYDAETDGDEDADEEVLTFELAGLNQLLAGNLPGDDAPDPYADLAEGLPGAAEALLAAGTDLNTPSGAPMHTAILAALDAPGRSADTISTLIAGGGDARVIHGQMGDNVFSWSMGYDHPETVSEESELAMFAVLSSEGADPDHMVPGQMAVLHRGILQNAGVQVDALLTIGADPDQCLPDEFEPAKLAGATPVMLAAPKPDLVRMLLDHGANAAATDKQGRDQLAFLEAEAAAARRRATPEDAWTVDHADALEASVALLKAHLAA